MKIWLKTIDATEFTRMPLPKVTSENPKNKEVENPDKATKAILNPIPSNSISFEEPPNSFIIAGLVPTVIIDLPSLVLYKKIVNKTKTTVTIAI